jgi:hypothetical protein
MSRPGSPAWRKAFDGVERLVGGPLESATNSPDVQSALVTVGRIRGAVTSPVGRVTSWGLHLVGLPSHADVLALRRQLNEVQREVATVHRELADAERVRQRGP